MHKRFQVTPFGGGKPLVQVGHVRMPKTFTANLSEDDDGAPDVALTFEVRSGVPECREVNIRATDDGREVKCSGLAGVRVEDILEAALRDLMLDIQIRTAGELPDWLDTEPGRTAVSESRKARVGRKVTVTDELLREVAEVYRANVAGHPTAAVADHFDKAHRTAALYVKRARGRGFLGAALKGKAGEQ